MAEVIDCVRDRCACCFNCDCAEDSGSVIDLSVEVESGAVSVFVRDMLVVTRIVLGLGIDVLETSEAAVAGVDGRELLIGGGVATRTESRTGVALL
jgi:hypothetical protein